MWQLKKTAACVGIIILFESAKIILQINKSDATYYYFVYNLFSCYQLLILLFLIVTLLWEELIFTRFFRNRRMRSAVFFLVIVVVCELVCTFLLYHPKLIPTNPKAFIDYYYEFDCDLIQYSRTASEYNNHLFYKLKNKNKFLYENREFSDSFNVNSKGFRDDESSLNEPSIIFLGDSYTLGWGVGQKETYSSVTENITKLKGLNAAMSSYGTARENMVLSTLDASNLRFIVWQYCNNDNFENETYINNNFLLPVRPKQEYDKIVGSYEWTKRYFPGKHFLTILKLYIKNLRKQLRKNTRPPESDALLKQSAKQDAEMFIKILATSKINWSTTKVIVTELNPKEYSSMFLVSLQQLIDKGETKKTFHANLFTVDLSSILKKEDYYTMDVHLTKEGNYKVGQYLAKTIKRLQVD